MIICANCGKELDVNANFCVNCGAQIVEVAEPEVIEPAEISLTEPDSFSDTENQTLSDDDKNFLDTTHRLLRWEQKAWKIGGTAYTILGAVFAGLYFLLGIIFAFVEPEFFVVFMLYSFLIGGSFIGVGIVSMQARKKVNYYINSLYNDIQPTVTRCSSVGMIVLCAIFNTIALVFFIINFTRMKSCGQRIAEITKTQQNQ